MTLYGKSVKIYKILKLSWSEISQGHHILLFNALNLCNWINDNNATTTKFEKLSIDIQRQFYRIIGTNNFLDQIEQEKQLVLDLFLFINYIYIPNLKFSLNRKCVYMY